jgi:hypothetical protein
MMMMMKLIYYFLILYMIDFVEAKCFRIDRLIPYVLEFAPGTDLHDNELVESGKLILQDKVRQTIMYKFVFVCLINYYKSH